MRAVRVAIAIVCCGAAALPASAGANPLTGGGSSDLLPPAAQTVVGDATQAVAQTVAAAVDVAQAPACAALAPGEDPPPGHNELAVGVCAGVYRVFTVHPKPGGGTYARSTPATFSTPTPVNVDGDPEPELTVTAAPTSLDLDEYTLRIERTGTGPLPVSVEAIVRLPAGMIEREAVNAGYDALAADAPPVFTATVKLPPATDGKTPIEADVATEGAGVGRPLAILGGMFDGPEAARELPLGGRLHYARMPAAASVDLLIGKGVEAALGVSSPTAVTVDSELVGKGTSMSVHAVVEDVASALSFAYRENAGAGTSMVYTASAPVTRLDADYRQLTSGKLVSQVVTRATDVPVGITVDQPQPGQGIVTTSGGPVGTVEVGVGSRRAPALLAGPLPYLHTVTDAASSSFAVKVERIVGVTYDTRAAIEVDALFAPLKPMPLRVSARDELGAVEGLVEHVPSHVKLDLDLAGGTISYDGFGEKVARITAEGHRSVPWLGRATNIAALVEQLPAKVDIGFTADGARTTFSTDAPVGRIEVAGRSGPDIAFPVAGPAAELLPEPGGGVLLRDRGSDYALAARVHGLRALTFERLATGTQKLTATTAGGPFSASYEDDVRSVRARIEALPPEVQELSVGPDEGRIAYRGSEPVAAISVRAQSSVPFFGASAQTPGAHHLVAAVKEFPKSATLTFTPPAAQGADRNAEFATDSPIGEVDIVASDKQALSPIPTGRMGVALTARPAEYLVAARVFGLEKVTLASAAKPGPDGDITDVALTTKTERRPFTALYADAAMSLRADVDDLPAQINRLEIAPSEGRVDYDGSHDIARIAVTGAASEPFFGAATDDKTGAVTSLGARHLALTVDDFPRGAEVRFAPPGDAAQSTTSLTASRRIAHIDFAASHAPPPASPLPAGRDGVALRNAPASGDYVVAARVTGLESVKLERTLTPVAGQTEPVADIELSTKTQGGPFTALYGDDVRTLRADVDDVPAEIQKLRVAPSAGTTEYAGSAPIASIVVTGDAQEPWFGRATDDATGAVTSLGARHFRLAVNDFPQGAVVTTDPSGSAPGSATAGFTASKPVGMVELLGAHNELATLADVQAPAPGVPLLPPFASKGLAPGEAGVSLRTSPSGYVVAARVFGLSRVSFKRTTVQTAAAQDVSDVELSATAAPGPFAIRYSDPERTVAAAIADLPASVEKLRLAPSEGRLVYDGAAAIASIRALVTAQQALFGEQTRLVGGKPVVVTPGARRLDVRVAGFPQAVEVGFTPPGSPEGDQVTSFSASAPVGKIEVIARDKPPAPGSPGTLLPSGEQGVSLTAKRTAFLLHGRLAGLEHAQVYRAVSTNAAGEQVDDYRLAARTAGGPFTVAFAGEDRSFKAEIDDLPANVAELTFAPSHGHVVFDGDGSGIDRLRFEAASADPLFAAAKHLSAVIEALPAHVAIQFAPDQQAEGDKVHRLTTSAPIGLIELLARDVPIGDRTAELDALLLEGLSPLTAGQLRQAGYNGLLHRDTRDIDGQVRFELGARIRSLSSVLVEQIPLEGTDGAQRYVADVELGDAPRPLRLVRDDNDQALAATVDALPVDTNVSIDPRKEVRLDASSDVDSIDFLASRKAKVFCLQRGADGKCQIPATVPRHFFGRAIHLRGRVKQLPAQVTVTFEQRRSGPPRVLPGQSLPQSWTEEKAGYGFTASAPVEEVEVIATDAAFQLTIPDGEAGVVYRDEPERFVAGGRVFGLRSASARLEEEVRRRIGGQQRTQNVAFDTQMRRGPFSVVYVDEQLGIRTRIANLPATVSVDAKLSEGTIAYTGSSMIDEITVSADHKQGAFFGEVTDGRALERTPGAKYLSGEIRGLPSQVTVGFAPSGGGTEISLRASAAIGRIEFLGSSARKHHDTVLFEGDTDGLVMRSATDNYEAGGRLRGLRSASVSEAAGSGTRVVTQLDAAPKENGIPTPYFPRAFRVLLHDFTDRVSVDIDRLPQTVDFAIGETGVVTYSGATSIPRVDVDARRWSVARMLGYTTPYFGSVSRIKASVEDLPTGIVFRSERYGGGVELIASAAVGSAEVLLTSGPEVALPADTSGVLMRETTSSFAVFARLRGLRRVALDPEPDAHYGPEGPVFVEFAGDRQPVTIDVALPGDSPSRPAKTITGLIDELPGAIKILKYAGIPNDARGTYDGYRYRASDPIERLELHARNLGELASGPNHLDVYVDDVPELLDLDIPDEGPLTVRAEALGGQTVGLVRVDARSSGSELKLPAGRNAIRFSDVMRKPGEDFRVAVRVGNLRKAAIEAPVIGVQRDTQGRLMTIDGSLRAAFKVAGTPPPLDIDIEKSAPFAEDTPEGIGAIIDATIAKPPRDLDLYIARNELTKSHFGFFGNLIEVRTSAGGIPHLELNMQIKNSTVMLADISNIPSRLDFCFGARFQTCDERTRFARFDNLSVAARTFGTASKRIRIDGRICVDSRDEDDPVTAYRLTLEECEKRPLDFITIYGLAFRDMSVALAAGAFAYPGDPIYDLDESEIFFDPDGVDGLAHLYFDTDGPGMLIDALRAQIDGNYVELTTSEDGAPVRATRWDALVDTDPTEYYARNWGVIRCPPPTIKYKLPFDATPTDITALAILRCFE